MYNNNQPTQPTQPNQPNEAIVLKNLKETDENPIMIRAYSSTNIQDAFLFALATERSEKARAYDYDKITVAIFAGADSALQSIKGVMDVGSSGLRLGYGEKTISNFDFKKIKNLAADKGKYKKLNINLPGVPNAVGMIHEDVSNGTRYLLSMDENPAKDVADFMGTSYNLPILEDWQETVYQELLKLGYLKEVDMYVDNSISNLRLFSIDLTEEQADHFVSDLIKSNRLKFPQEGTGEKINEYSDLGEYILGNVDEMTEKITQSVIPTHIPTESNSLPVFETFERKLFPVQAHAATAVAKSLRKKKSMILQGEMSTGKSSMFIAAVHGNASLKGKQGYFTGLICPPSLTTKWPKEIKMLIPDAEVHVIKNTTEFIRFHREWKEAGRPKPTKPTFFIFSFTTLRNDSANRPAIQYKYIRTKGQAKKGDAPYREGYICHDCGKPHMVVVDTTYEIQGDKEVATDRTRIMNESEFGNTRRLGKSTANPPNGFCYHCGASLWSKTVMRRYASYRDYVESYEKPLTEAIRSNNQKKVKELQESQPDFKSSSSMPRRVAVAEYIRRQCKGFFDYAVVDEVHMLKASGSAQGLALHALVNASKRTVAGTGTLFGGKASDIYYLLFRLYPTHMIKAGFDYHGVTAFSEQYGNIEEIAFVPKDDGSTTYTNKASRGTAQGPSKRKKEVPGYTPLIYPAFLLEHVVNVRLKDVWPNPVEFVDTPTIFVDATNEQKSVYDKMIRKFENEIDSREDGYKLYTQMIDYGIAYLDNVVKFPSAYYKNLEGNRELIWDAEHLDGDQTFPKEAKLQEIVTHEMSEERPCIVYVRDTGSTNEARDVRPRLKQKLEEIGAKVCVLDTTTVATNKRSEWLEQKIINEGYDVCIVSQELVQVGLDLLCTPTLIYYQFSWSLYTLQQSARRAWRIGQTEECRNYYLAYRDCYQEYVATLIARKSKAAAAVNGEASSEGISQMLGDDGDLQSILLKSIKDGSVNIQGGAEEWIAEASERSLDLLDRLSKPVLAERKKNKETANNELFDSLTTKNEPTEYFDIEDLSVEEALEVVEYCTVSTVVSEYKAEIKTFGELKAKTNVKSKKKKKVSDEQLTFDLFAV